MATFSPYETLDDCCPRRGIPFLPGSWQISLKILNPIGHLDLAASSVAVENLFSVEGRFGKTKSQTMTNGTTIGPLNRYYFLPSRHYLAQYHFRFQDHGCRHPIGEVGPRS